MVEDRARKRGLALSCEIDDAVPNHAELDPEQFRQVVVNLLTNAVKYTNECRIDLVVEPARPDGRAPSRSRSPTRAAASPTTNRRSSSRPSLRSTLRPRGFEKRWG